MIENNCVNYKDTNNESIPQMKNLYSVWRKYGIDQQYKEQIVDVNSSAISKRGWSWEPAVHMIGILENRLLVASVKCEGLETPCSM